LFRNFNAVLTMNKKSNQHGGARKGAGRKATNVKKKVIGIRSSSTTISLMEKIAQMYGDKDTAHSTVISGYLTIRECTLREIKGVFTRAELVALISAQNMVMLIPEMQADTVVMISNLEDYETYQNGISEAGADPKRLIEKISRMTASQVYFLQECIAFTELSNSIEQFIMDFQLDLDSSLPLPK
jgi:hypothetical protein